MFFGVSALAGLVAAGAALPIVGSMGIGARKAIDSFNGLPAVLDTPPLPQQTVILAADGTKIATIFSQNRTEVPLSQVSPFVRQAIVAIEDSRFLDHHGVDLRGTLRALVTNSSAGGVQQGGSTLTQQYVKNVLIISAQNPAEAAAAHSRTLLRKIREARYALALEQRLTKAQILERYLNIAYFGHGAYGIEAAARTYFSVSAAQLTLVQSATLAGLVQQPVGYDPTRHPHIATVRRNVVLRRMFELGYLTKAQELKAQAVLMKTELHVSSGAHNGCTTSFAPFFCNYVLRVIRDDPAFGATPADRQAIISEGGLIIRTTLSTTAQSAAQSSVNNEIPPTDGSQKAAAMSMVRPGTGEILAMAENRLWGIKGTGYTTYNYNVNKSMGGTVGMQAGSTFKIFTLAAAIKQGISPYSSLPAPPKRVFTGFTNCTTGAPFPPFTVNNDAGGGTFDMFSGVAYSVNTFFMALEQQTGLCDPVNIAKSVGVTLANGKPVLSVPTFTLGTMEVSPLTMANAYATFAAHGVFCQPIAILSALDRNGKSLPVPSANCKSVLPRHIADTVTAILSNVLDGPYPGRTGQGLGLGRDAAGKTGTTNSNAAVWFCGFTPDLAGAVWVGDPRGGFRYPMHNITINGTFYQQVFGATLPGPIWHNAMSATLANTPPATFDLQTDFGIAGARQSGGPGPSTSPTASGSPAASGSPSGSPGPTGSPTPTTTNSPKPTKSPPG
jgi:membrane peptidoglycan carboxypeptidase